MPHAKKPLKDMQIIVHGHVDKHGDFMDIQ